MRTARRYWLFQIPGLIVIAGGGIAAQLLLDVSGWVTVSVLALWLLKDLAIYPLVKNAYAKRTPDDPLIGLSGRVTKAVGDREGGRVEVGGALWSARTETGPLEVGAAVRVTGVRDMTLIVAPDEKRKDRIHHASPEV